MADLHFNIRIVLVGERYGAADSIIHTIERNTPRGCHGAMVEFYDPRFAHTPHGQFVSRYFVQTLLDRAPGALALEGSVAEWTVSASQMAEITETLREMRSTDKFRPRFIG